MILLIYIINNIQVFSSNLKEIVKRAVNHRVTVVVVLRC